jgi:ferredoxin
MPTVSIDGQERTYSVESGSNLLDSLNKQNASLPAGCLAGSCGACRLIIVRGPHNLSEPDQMEKDTIESIKVNYRRMYGPEHLKTENVRLGCRAIVNGDVMIKLLD